MASLRVSGWFELLMLGESQINIEIFSIREKLGAGDAIAHA